MHGHLNVKDKIYNGTLNAILIAQRFVGGHQTLLLILLCLSPLKWLREHNIIMTQMAAIYVVLSE